MRSLGVAKWKKSKRNQRKGYCNKWRITTKIKKQKKLTTQSEKKGNSHVETNMDGATMGKTNVGLTKTMLVPHHRSKDN